MNFVSILILMMPTKSPLKKEILKQAFAVALSSDAPKKMSAMLLDKRNRVISTGVNSYEITHTQQFYAAVMAANKYNQPWVGHLCLSFLLLGDRHS
jgi:deoxycytidylate deaminase